MSCSPLVDPARSVWDIADIPGDFAPLGVDRRAGSVVHRREARGIEDSPLLEGEREAFLESYSAIQSWNCNPRRQIRHGCSYYLVISVSTSTNQQIGPIRLSPTIRFLLVTLLLPPSTGQTTSLGAIAEHSFPSSMVDLGSRRRRSIGPVIGSAMRLTVGFIIIRTPTGTGPLIRIEILRCFSLQRLGQLGVRIDAVTGRGRMQRLFLRRSRSMRLLTVPRFLTTRRILTTFTRQRWIGRWWWGRV